MRSRASEANKPLLQNNLLQALGARKMSSELDDPTSPVDVRGRTASMDQVNDYRRSTQNRHAINSPAPESKHKDYNRYKYYDKLRTSLINEELRAGPALGSDALELSEKASFVSEFLRPPSHVID